MKRKAKAQLLTVATLQSHSWEKLILLVQAFGRAGIPLTPHVWPNGTLELRVRLPLSQ